MGAPQKNLLRALTEAKRQQLARLTKASSERLDVVQRARALLALVQIVAQWNTWLRPRESADGLSPLRILPARDNVARHLIPDLVIRLFRHGMMLLSTLLSGSWLNMVESVQRIIVHLALSNQHARTAEDVFDWLEPTVTGWNRKPIPFGRKGKRYQRRKRAHPRRLGELEAALLTP